MATHRNCECNASFKCWFCQNATKLNEVLSSDARQKNTMEMNSNSNKQPRNDVDNLSEISEFSDVLSGLIGHFGFYQFVWCFIGICINTAVFMPFFATIYQVRLVILA